jgi:sarcosine oxidase / L-pipecolate oxidase
VAEQLHFRDAMERKADANHVTRSYVIAFPQLPRFADRKTVVQILSDAMATEFCNNGGFDYAIVGGGCIGASIALAFQREWPNARIVWFEGTDKHTASKDVNKIIRTPYPDKDYIALAEKAMKMWKTQAPYCNFYHETSWIQVIKEGSHRSTMKGPEDKALSTKEMLNMVGSHDKPNLDPGEELWLNKNIGYVDSALALEAVAKEASTLGVVREKKDVTRLIVNDGICQGVEADGDSVAAENTVVAAGPWTPRLLEISKVEFPDGFFTVAAVGVATIALDEAEFDDLKAMPILVTEGGVSYSVNQILSQLTSGRRSDAFGNTQAPENDYNAYFPDQAS